MHSIMKLAPIRHSLISCINSLRILLEFHLKACTAHHEVGRIIQISYPSNIFKADSRTLYYIILGGCYDYKLHSDDFVICMQDAVSNDQAKSDNGGSLYGIICGKTCLTIQK